MAGEDAAAAAVLDQYTASCIEQVMAKANELIGRLGSDGIRIPAMYKPYVGIYIGNFAAFNLKRLFQKLFDLVLYRIQLVRSKKRVGSSPP